MKREQENLRFYMFRRMTLGDSPMEVGSVHGPSCSHDTVRRRIRGFQRGKRDIGDEPRSGAPTPATNENAIELMTSHLTANDPVPQSTTLAVIVTFHVMQLPNSTRRTEN